MMTKLTDQDIIDWTHKIGMMTHVEMCKLWRFAPSGHPIFDSALPLYDIFSKRFTAFGGMTTKISKELGYVD